MSRGFVFLSALVFSAGLLGLNWVWQATPLETAAIAPEDIRRQPSQSPSGRKDDIGDTSDPELLRRKAFGRPLFVKGRRFVIEVAKRPEPKKPSAPVVPKPEPVAAKSKAPPPEITLLGIKIDGKSDTALLGIAGFDVPDWYQVGQEIQDWKLTSINAEEVIFRSGDREHVVRLYDF